MMMYSLCQCPKLSPHNGFPVCIEETVVYEPLLPARKIRRSHSVLILRGLEGVCLVRSMLTPSDVGGTEESEPERKRRDVDGGVWGAS